MTEPKNQPKKNSGDRPQKPIIRRPKPEPSGQQAPAEIQPERIVPDLVSLDPDKPVRVIPLGGLCEIGKNTWAFECDGKILIVDAGLAFPTDEMHGVNIVLPDISYLIENESKIAGLVLTHGHEDHIGGITHMLRRLHVPIIYGPPLAIGLLEGKLKEHGLLNKSTLKRYQPRETMQLGPFAVTATRNNHSIPDSFCLIIQSPAGKIVHSGDFKFDHTPVDGELFDIAPLAEAGADGVKLLISDSTNAEAAGYTPSEREVFTALEEAFIKAQKRIIITTFASQVHRMRQILEISQKYGRKVAVLGRSMLNIALVSRKLGYMNFPDGLLIRADEISQYPQNKIVILTTGSQGEPLSALTRISNGSHRQVSVIPGDTVIFSATPIPGNERSVASTINALFARGADVVYGREAGVHVSGHCSQEEQKMMLSLVNPQYFMPAHGEYRMLVKHARLAEEVCGLPQENVFVMENGDVLELQAENARIAGEVPAGIIMVDMGAQTDTIAESTVQDRAQLSQQGVVSMILTVANGELVTEPDIVMKGLVLRDMSDKDKLTSQIKERLRVSWPSLTKDSDEGLEAQLRDLVQECLQVNGLMPAVQIILTQATMA